MLIDDYPVIVCFVWMPVIEYQVKTMNTDKIQPQTERIEPSFEIFIRRMIGLKCD